MHTLLQLMPGMIPAIPEIFLGFAICLVLLFEVFVGVKRPGATSTLTLLVLVAGAALTARYADVGHEVVLFDGMYVTDPLAYVLKLAGFLVVAVALLYSRTYLENRNILRGEYYVLALTALLGIFVLVSRPTACSPSTSASSCWPYPSTQWWHSTESRALPRNPP